MELEVPGEMEGFVDSRWTPVKSACLECTTQPANLPSPLPMLVNNTLNIAHISQRESCTFGHSNY